MSPGLRAMNDQAAAAGPFAKAAGLLEDLAGVSLTVKRVERAAEASGAAAAAAVRGRAARSPPASSCRCRRRRLPDKLYAAIDGTGVPDDRGGDRRAGRQGRGRPGPDPRGQARRLLHPGQASTRTDTRSGTGTPPAYMATFEPAAVFAGLVEAEGIRRGADHVRQLTILGDGAAWICYPDVGIADLIPVPRLSR